VNLCHGDLFLERYIITDLKPIVIIFKRYLVATISMYLIVSILER
jgi:hypothetical protein